MLQTEFEGGNFVSQHAMGWRVEVPEKMFKDFHEDVVCLFVSTLSSFYAPTI